MGGSGLVKSISQVVRKIDERREKGGDVRKEVQLELEDGVSQNIEVEIIDSGRLRLLESPMFTDGDLRLGTVVEVVQTSEEDYKVKKIISQSNY